VIAYAVVDSVLYYCFDPFSLFYNRTAIRSLSPLQRFYWEPIGKMYRAFDFRAVRKSRAIFTIDQYTSDFIRRLYGRKSFVTRSGVDTEFFKPRARGIQVFEKYSGKRIIFSQTHGYSYFDGCEFVLLAAALIRRRFPDLHIIFTSMFANPRRQSHLESLAQQLGIAPMVEFAGFVDERLLPHFYALADVIVQPAIDTNTILTVKEAMSCERPVIVFEGGPAEDIRSADCGVIVPRLSASKLAEAIETILGDAEIAARMGRNGRKRAVNLFAWDAVAANVISAIEAELEPK
jgi:glycosyltransferase involved in cell wall biosynthesis